MPAIRGMLGQTHDSLGQHVAHGATRHVVENDRQVDRIGNGNKVPVQAFLGGSVVVRDDREQSIGAGGRQFARQLDAFRRGIRATARDDRQATGDTCFGAPDQFRDLGRLERRRFPGRAADDDSVRAFGDVEIQQALPGLEIDRPVGAHWRHERWDAALEHSAGASAGRLLMLRKRKAAKQGKITVHAPVRRRYTESRHP